MRERLENDQEIKDTEEIAQERLVNDHERLDNRHEAGEAGQ